MPSTDFLEDELAKAELALFNVNRMYDKVNDPRVIAIVEDTTKRRNRSPLLSPDENKSRNKLSHLDKFLANAKTQQPIAPKTDVRRTPIKF